MVLRTPRGSWLLTRTDSTALPMVCLGPKVKSNRPWELPSRKVMLCLTYTGMATRLGNKPTDTQQVSHTKQLQGFPFLCFWVGNISQLTCAANCCVIAIIQCRTFFTVTIGIHCNSYKYSHCDNHNLCKEHLLGHYRYNDVFNVELTKPHSMHCSPCKYHDSHKSLLIHRKQANNACVPAQYVSQPIVVRGITIIVVVSVVLNDV